MNKQNFSVVTNQTPYGKRMVGMFDIDASTPDKELPVSLWIKIPLKNPDPNGLSIDSEAEALNKFEDEIEALVEGRFVGRITLEGTRELYLYVREVASIEASLKTFRSTNSYKFEFETTEDPEWEIIDSYLKKIK